MKTEIIALVIGWVLVMLCSCSSHIQPPTQKFLSMLETNNEAGGNQLRFDGVYHHIDRYHIGIEYVDGKLTKYVDTPYVDHPVFFFKKGLVAYDNALSLDSTIFSESMRQYGTQKDSYLNEWGIFETKGDTIRAIIYMTLAHRNFFNRTQKLQCYFQGIMHGTDRIRQWQMVPPYPDTLPIDQDEIDRLKTPKDLCFKSVPIQKLINPDSAWINELKTKN